MLIPVWKYSRTLLFLSAAMLLGLGCAASSDAPVAAPAQSQETAQLGTSDIPPLPEDVNALGGEVAAAPQAAPAQPKETKKLGKYEIPPPPEDVNELSMEVAALRVLYLLKADSYQLRDGKRRAENCAMKPRKRQPAEVSANYRKVLTELRSALIAGEEDRINELSEQLEELAKDEMPFLDDGVEISERAPRGAWGWMATFEPESVVAYLAAYGDDFPSPRDMIIRALRLDGKGEKPSLDEWKEIRATTIREVTWLVVGSKYGPETAQKKAEQVAQFLDKGYALTDEELKKQKDNFLNQIGSICHVLPTEIVRRVINRDLAELLSNPRMWAAADARARYLAKEAKEKN